MFSVPGEVQPVSRTASVESLIAQFDNNPFVISRALRQLRDTDAGRFEEAALRAIAGSPESSGIRFVARLIPLNDAVLELIANPQAFEMDGCRRIVEVMRRIDAQTESKLIRQISERHLPPRH